MTGAQSTYGTNDTTALANAATAAASSGGTIYLHNGSYFNNNPVVLQNCVSLRGESMTGASLFNNGVTIAGYSCEVANLTVELNGRRTSGARYNGITVQGANHTIDNVTIRNSTN